MAKSSERYWREREAAQRKKDITDQMAYNREVRRIFQQMQDNVQKEIDAFYGKYAQKEGITLAEAKRRVSAIDFEAYERKAKRYVEAASRDRREGTKERAGYYFSDQANEEMRLYNLTMKVNRLELLKANIGLELVDGFDNLNETFDEKLTRHATNEFERLAGILGDSVRNNPQYVHAIVNASFHNATYSDRIWTHQDTLKAALDRQIQIGLIQGKSSTELARAIRQEFGVSRKNAERLMITEMRRVRTEVAKISYEENGNTQYQFLALGGKPCNDCADLDSRVFPVKEMMPGVNAPPMHPRCLCSTAPYWDEAKFQEWLDSGAAADGVPWAEFEEGKDLQPEGARAIMNVDTGGQRNESPLTNAQIEVCFAYAEQLGMPREKMSYSERYWTSYNPAFDLLLIGTDAYPASKAKTANGKIGYRGAIAHEIIGHRGVELKGGSRFEQNDPLDEAQASIRASRFAPDLSQKERFLLLRDAVDRLHKAGYQVREVRGKLDIEEE